jgi:dephospho-CoA kinase
MLRIGLTGGIGSGKSTVARIFKVLGIPVYNADEASKKLMSEDQDLKNKIVAAFGDNSYNNGLLNRKFLSDQVFHDRKKLDLLNSIVHPATLKDVTAWLEKQDAPYIIKEAALIFESGSQKMLDYVIGVRAPLALRIEHTMRRDHATSEEVEARIHLQMDEEKKMQLCDFIIINDEQQMLIPQVLKLHNEFIKNEKSLQQ